MRVDPAMPAAAAALTATVTQAPGESATQTERVRFPPQFGFNPALRVTHCTAADERAARCPDTSRIGTAMASTMFGDFAGGVFLTTDFRFVVFLRGLAGLVEQEVSGYLLLHGDGSVESVLDGLPDVAATSASVSFDSGPRSLLLTPRACGTYDLEARFVSHAGDQVTRTVGVQIGGCDSTPRIERAGVSPDRLSVGGRRAVVSWRLSEAGAATLVEVDRIVRIGRFDGRRRELRIHTDARAGANRVAIRALPAGRYQVMLKTMSARGRLVDIMRLPLTISRRASR
jgi:hypothetical protein